MSAGANSLQAYLLPRAQIFVYTNSTGISNTDVHPYCISHHRMTFLTLRPVLMDFAIPTRVCTQLQFSYQSNYILHSFLFWVLTKTRYSDDKCIISFGFILSSHTLAVVVFVRAACDTQTDPSFCLSLCLCFVRLHNNINNTDSYRTLSAPRHSLWRRRYQSQPAHSPQPSNTCVYPPPLPRSGPHRCGPVCRVCSGFRDCCLGRICGCFCATANALTCLPRSPSGARPSSTG